jgi:hypothetical protein
MESFQNFKASNLLTSEQLKLLKINHFKKPSNIRYDEEDYPILEYEEGYIEDEEFGYFVKAENYYIPVPLLEGGGINLTLLEKSDNFWNFARSDVGFKWGRYQRYTCGVLLWAYCEECGYEYMVRVPCGREWCEECGCEYSLYHRRLYLKALCYALEMYDMAGAVGYLVITCPEELRERWKDKEELSRVVRYVQRMLQREGFPCGYYRWHFAGDSSKRWYPHLNVLIPGGYMDKEKLERIKKLIYNHLGVLVVNYEYAKTIPKIKHLCRYISRPTWNLQNEVKPDGFKGFRKYGIWGKKYFKSAKIEKTRDLEEFVAFVEDLIKKGCLRDETEKLAFVVLHGRCCGCYEKLKWSKRSVFDIENKKIYKLGWGCWVVMDGGVKLPGCDPPGISDNWEDEIWKELL